MNSSTRWIRDFMRLAYRTLLHILVLFLSLCCSRAADPSLARQAASVLMNQYETVISSTSILLAQMHHPSTEESGARALQTPFIYLFMALSAIGPETQAVLESNSDVVLTSARNFIGPAGLGMVRSQNCAIAILKPGTARLLDSEFRESTAIVIGNRRIWNWSIPAPEGRYTEINFYAAIVANSYFVLATSLEDFREVAEALEQTNVDLNSPRGRDLTSLRSHSYWGYRAIRRDEGDAFSSGLHELPSTATELEIFTDITHITDGKLVFNILLTDDPTDSPPAGLPVSERLRFKRVENGLWQAEIPLDMSRRTTGALLRVLFYFGYGVFL